MNLQGATAFVTGGSGFIGGRLIEVLTRQYGAQVKTLVRGTTTAGGGAFRAAAAGAEMVFGSLLDPNVLDVPLQGCDVVFHCAYGTHGSVADQRRVTLDGTRLLAEAAGRAGVRHFVHLSSVVTFGGNTPAVVDESFVNPKLWPWPYAHHKLDAEGALASAAKSVSMPYTVLRLGMVYGPYGSSYTEGPLNAMRVGRMALVNDGGGVSCATYVDDVIQAMLLAAEAPGEGDTYMIRGPDTVTWRHVYSTYEAMLGKQGRLVDMTREQMRAAAGGQWRMALKRIGPETLAALMASPSFRSTAGDLPFVRSAYAKFGKALGVRGAAQSASAPAPGPKEEPIMLIPDLMVDYFANTSIFSIDKARSKLGYSPVYDLERGMAVTEQWARWANLIP